MKVLLRTPALPCSLELRRYRAHHHAEGLRQAAAALAQLTQLAEVGSSVAAAAGSEEEWYPDDAESEDDSDDEAVESKGILAALRQLTSLALHDTRLPPDLLRLSGLRRLRVNSTCLDPRHHAALGVYGWTPHPWTALSGLALLELKTALPGAAPGRMGLLPCLPLRCKACVLIATDQLLVLALPQAWKRWPRCQTWQRFEWPTHLAGKRIAHGGAPLSACGPLCGKPSGNKLHSFSKRLKYAPKPKPSDCFCFSTALCFVQPDSHPGHTAAVSAF
jgi:hypothetical protein